PPDPNVKFTAGFVNVVDASTLMGASSAIFVKLMMLSTICAAESTAPSAKLVAVTASAASFAFVTDASTIAAVSTDASASSETPTEFAAIFAAVTASSRIAAVVTASADNSDAPTAPAAI